MTNLEEEIRFLILALQREGNRLLAAALAPAELTPSQAEVISLLAEHNQLSLKGLGALLVCETGENPSRLVDRMVARGLVLRHRSKEDARSVTLQLSDAGRQLYDQAVAPVEQALHAQIGSAIPKGQLEKLHELLANFAAASGADAAIVARREQAS